MIDLLEFESSRLNHNEIQIEELAILDRFNDFCRKHDLQFTPIGGTMLGAVRHGGFIPWDDDIDIGMPRPSYERFLSLSNDIRSETGLELLGYGSLDIHESPFSKLVNPNIKVKPALETDTTNLWIDIVPIDAMPDDINSLAALCDQVGHEQKCLMFSMSNVSSSSSLIRKVVKAIATPIRKSRGFLRRHAMKLVSLSTHIPYGSTPYVGVLAWGMYGEGERFHLSGLEDMSTCTFEGLELPCMSCWDEYLSGIYGDYMTLPPEEKRVAHGLKAWRVDRETE